MAIEQVPPALGPRPTQAQIIEKRDVENRVSRISVPLLFAAFGLLAVLTYLGASRAGGFVGFPLDDAWIHQTYARNLARHGEFAFMPGQPSAGSTAPLWTALLAVGYWLAMDYRVWTYGLGAALLALNAWLAYRLVLDLWPGRTRAAVAAGIFVALEWHLVWAAASGMETLIFSAAALMAFLAAGGRMPLNAAWAGIAAGLSILARPDGLVLMPFVLGRVALRHSVGSRRALAVAVVNYVIGFSLVFVPYLGFNVWVGGSLWPNTFYAKQAEYAVMREAPLLDRLWNVGHVPFVGAQALLVPGIVWAALQWARRGKWAALLLPIWAATFALAYALRLPWAYQHGRYLMPVIPVLVAVGVAGLADLVRLGAAEALPRILSRAWVAASAVLVLAFWLVGAGAYARDVQIIETEMVAVAHWINTHTEPGALVAAHDIGALGYFSHRKLLDLAGLVSPEVIPFIRDEARLRVWLDASGADYVVTFPTWYPELVRPLEASGHAKVFQSTAPFSPAAGGENMAVYAWSEGSP